MQSDRRKSSWNPTATSFISDPSNTEADEDLTSSSLDSAFSNTSSSTSSPNLTRRTRLSALNSEADDPETDPIILNIRQQLPVGQRNQYPGRQSKEPLDFKYNDTDTLQNELAELYSYTELYDFVLNREAFDYYFYIHCENEPLTTWINITDEEKSAFLRTVIELISSVEDKNEQLKALRCVLYVVQGSYADVESENEAVNLVRRNCCLLYKAGAFPVLLDALIIESASRGKRNLEKQNSIEDSKELRVIINIIYTMIELFRRPYEEIFFTCNDDSQAKTCQAQTNNEDEKKLFEFCAINLKRDIQAAITGEMSLVIFLIYMFKNFSDELYWHYPLKKILLLLWKSILMVHGGYEELKSMKEERRKARGLDELLEDTIQAADMITQAAKSVKSNQPNAKTKFDMQESESSANPNVLKKHSSNGKRLKFTSKARQIDIDRFLKSSRERHFATNGVDQVPEMRAPLPTYSLMSDTSKFDEQNWHTLAFGPMDEPTRKSYQTYLKHRYISLAEVDLQDYKDLRKYPCVMERKLQNFASVTHANEKLYKQMLQILPTFVVKVLQCFVAALPGTKQDDTVHRALIKTKNGVDAVRDVLPDVMPTSFSQIMKLSIDTARHKEIILKASSSIVLLLMKHFRVNHVLQFEYLCSLIVKSNGIPLWIRFFNQQVPDYVEARNVVSVLDYPSCVIGGNLLAAISASYEKENSNLVIDLSQNGDAEKSSSSLHVDLSVLLAASQKNIYKDTPTKNYCWRTMYTTINMLRLLQKIVKWKYSRSLCLILFKCFPALRGIVKIRCTLLQIYGLKLIRNQVRYLGRLWKKNNMRIVSLIYTMVRHRYNDDWAGGIIGMNEATLSEEIRDPKDEHALRNLIESYNSFCYAQINILMPSLNPSEDVLIMDQLMANPGLNDAVSQAVRLDSTSMDLSRIFFENKTELGEFFKGNYEAWLEDEVFGRSVNWDELMLVDDSGSVMVK